MATAAQDVEVQELREHLGDYLQRVVAGEHFRVAQDGRPVALFSPLPEPTRTRDRMIAEGRIIPAKADLLDLGPPLVVPLRMSSKEALDLGGEERLP